MNTDNDFGFGLLIIKQEGMALAFDIINNTEEETISSRWMELNIPDDWTEEQILTRVKQWIEEERK